MLLSINSSQKPDGAFGDPCGIPCNSSCILANSESSISLNGSEGSPLGAAAGLPKFVIGGIGASLAVVVSTISYFSLSKKGFKFQITSPLHAFHGILSRDSDTECANQGALDEDATVTEY